MIVNLQTNAEWLEAATEKMVASLEKCRQTLEPFLAGSDGDGRTEADQKKTVKNREAKMMAEYPELKEARAMAKSDIYCRKKFKSSVEYNTLH
jgi:hypothetical protein